MDETAGRVGTVGVVGDDSAVVAALEDAGASVTTGSAEDFAAGDSDDDATADTPDVLVAVGEQALLSVGRRAPRVSVLPVAAGRGVRSVPRESVTAAVGQLMAGDWRTDSHPVVDVTLGSDVVASAVTDVTLVTEEAAHISEYTVRCGEDRVARIRADGVVVATPAGSPGYARSAGGPVVAPGTGVGVTAPIAPFVTDPDHWVLPLSAVELAVERDTTAVELLVDDRSLGTVDPADRVSTAVADRFETVVIPAGVSPYGATS